MSNLANLRGKKIEFGWNSGTENCKKVHFDISKEQKFQFLPIWKAKKESFVEIQEPKIAKYFVFDIPKERRFQFWPMWEAKKKSSLG